MSFNLVLTSHLMGLFQNLGLETFAFLFAHLFGVDGCNACDFMSRDISCSYPYASRSAQDSFLILCLQVILNKSRLMENSGCKAWFHIKCDVSAGFEHSTISLVTVSHQASYETSKCSPDWMILAATLDAQLQILSTCDVRAGRCMYTLSGPQGCNW